MVIISGRRGWTGPGRSSRASPGDRRSPLTRRDRARSSRAQSTHPTRSFAFRRSADNSGLPELVFHVGRRTMLTVGRVRVRNLGPPDCAAPGRRINGRLVLFFGERGVFIASPAVSARRTVTAFIASRPTDVDT